MSLLRDLTVGNEDEREFVPLAEALEEAIKSLPGNKNGGVLASAQQLFKANPTLIAGAGALALLGMKAYKRNRRNTIHLHAKSPYERKMMTSVVDALTKSGKFRVQRIRFEAGGKSWALKRVWK